MAGFGGSTGVSKGYVDGAIAQSTAAVSNIAFFSETTWSQVYAKLKASMNDQNGRSIALFTCYSVAISGILTDGNCNGYLKGYVTLSGANGNLYDFFAGALSTGDMYVWRITASDSAPTISNFRKFRDSSNIVWEADKNSSYYGIVDPDDYTTNGFYQAGINIDGSNWYGILLVFVGNNGHTQQLFLGNYRMYARSRNSASSEWTTWRNLESTAFHKGDTFMFNGAQTPFRTMSNLSTIYFNYRLPKSLGSDVTSFSIAITANSSTWFSNGNAGSVASGATASNIAISGSGIRFSLPTTATPLASSGFGICELNATVTFT